MYHRGAGRVVLGLHPTVDDERVTRAILQLTHAGFNTALSAEIRQDLWLKLCTNLLSAINVLATTELKASSAYWEFRRNLLVEARDTLAAHGILARSCDGQDLSLEEMIERQALPVQARTTSGEPSVTQIHNSVYTALVRGQELEPLHYHSTIVEMAERKGMKVPANESFLQLLMKRRIEAGCLGRLPV